MKVKGYYMDAIFAGVLLLLMGIGFLYLAILFLRGCIKCFKCNTEVSAIVSSIEERKKSYYDMQPGLTRFYPHYNFYFKGRHYDIVSPALVSCKFCEGEQVNLFINPRKPEQFKMGTGQQWVFLVLGAIFLFWGLQMGCLLTGEP